MIHFELRIALALAAVVLVAIIAAWPHAAGLAQGQQVVVQGRWGALVDPDASPRLATERDRVEHLRRLQMRAISAHYRTVETIVSHKGPLLNVLGIETRKLADYANSLPTLFPEGSAMAPGSYGASPKIWAEFPRFVQHIAGFAEATQTLAGATREPARWTAALAAVRHECLACHQAFRVRQPTK